MDTLEQRAELLEALLPRVMRSLYCAHDDDPLSEIPLAQLRVIRVLYAGGKTISELATELSHSVSSATQIIHRLEETGLVERSRGEDKRVRHLALTAEGRRLMDERRSRRVKRATSILMEMSEDDQYAVINGMQKLIDARCRMSEHDSEPLLLTSDWEKGDSIPQS